MAQALSYIHFQVGFGKQGLIKLGCSDWNDCIFYFLKSHAYPDIFQMAESTLNATMAVSVGNGLAQALDALQVKDATFAERVIPINGRVSGRRPTIWSQPPAILLGCPTRKASGVGSLCIVATRMLGRSMRITDCARGSRRIV